MSSPPRATERPHRRRRFMGPTSTATCSHPRRARGWCQRAARARHIAFMAAQGRRGVSGAAAAAFPYRCGNTF